MNQQQRLGRRQDAAGHAAVSTDTSSSNLEDSLKMCRQLWQQSAGASRQCTPGTRQLPTHPVQVGLINAAVLVHLLAVAEDDEGGGHLDLPAGCKDKARRADQQEPAKQLSPATNW